MTVEAGVKMSGSTRQIRETAIQDARIIVITLPAEIDIGNADQVRDTLVSALASGATVVLADGTETRFCDCAAIRALVSAHQRAGATEAQLHVAIASPWVRQIITLLGADEILLVHPSLGHAQRSAAFSYQAAAGR